MVFECNDCEYRFESDIPVQTCVGCNSTQVTEVIIKICSGGRPLTHEEWLMTEEGLRWVKMKSMVISI